MVIVTEPQISLCVVRCQAVLCDWNECRTFSTDHSVYEYCVCTKPILHIDMDGRCEMFGDNK